MSVQPGTPLPWAATISGDEVELHDTDASDGFGLYVYSLTDGVSLKAEDATYITLACNSFLELVAALEAMVEEKADYMRLNHLGDPEQQHTIKQARAALSTVQLG